MIHFYDPDAQEWRAIENPTASDIAGTHRRGEQSAVPGM